MRYADGEEDKVVDVTIPVQALVSSGKLDIPGGRPKVRKDQGFLWNSHAEAYLQSLASTVQFTRLLRPLHS